MPLKNAVAEAARTMQLLSAAKIRGTPAAKERSSKAAKAVSPEAAHLRARKAAAARHGLPWPPLA